MTYLFASDNSYAIYGRKYCIFWAFKLSKSLEGYSSNTKNFVPMEDLKLACLKSHYCHILNICNQWLHALFCPKRFMTPWLSCVSFSSQFATKLLIIRICLYFIKSYSHFVWVWDVFHPSSFDTIVQLTFHVVKEVWLCGLVYLKYTTITITLSEIYNNNNNITPILTKRSFGSSSLFEIYVPNRAFYKDIVNVNEKL